MAEAINEKRHNDDAHQELRPTTESAEFKDDDLEKSNSLSSKRALSQTETRDYADDVVTAKTWLVVATMSFSYGVSFWPVPFFSQIQSEMAISFGSAPAQGTWITSSWIAAATIGFMVCGANSDLFGRRWFILSGNILVFIGAIVGATSHRLGQSIVAHTILGLGGANCQLTAFALPELLPNRWRHIGVVLADGMAFFVVIVAPVTARIAGAHGDVAWRWSYWATVISIAVSFVVLFLFYYPPKHPRGIPWGQAIRHLDWIGIWSFTFATALILSGIVYVQLLPSSNPIVIGLLVSGFAALIFFSLWETFAPLKEPLTPTRLFTANKGRTLSAPFVVGFVVTMFYYGTNIVWPTMISVYFTHANTPAHIIYLLATVQGFGVLVGGLALSFGGNYFQHWKWQMGISVAWMTFWGGMLAYITPEREGMAVAFCFLCAAGFGYAQYLSIAYIQFGADQVELGIAGGLAGVAREAGGAVAVTVFQTILVSVQTGYAASHIIPAAEAAGASRKVAEAVAAALPLGTAALEKVHGLTDAIAAAAGDAFVDSYVHGLRNVAYAQIGFGTLATIACFFLEDIGPKMTRKIEVFLENDREADKNKYH